MMTSTSSMGSRISSKAACNSDTAMPRIRLRKRSTIGMAGKNGRFWNEAGQGALKCDVASKQIAFMGPATIAPTQHRGGFFLEPAVVRIPFNGVTCENTSWLRHSLSVLSGDADAAHAEPPARTGSHLFTEHRIQLSNEIPSRDYRDPLGNVCTRLVAPAGLLEIRNEFVISDNGLPDEVSPRAEQWPIDSLPDEVLAYLLGSRYCDTEKLSQLAWQQFGSTVGGWQRVQAICDYVHNQLEFGYHHARSDRHASEGQ